MLRRRLIISILLTATALAGGCKSRCDLVEAELRLKDRQLREVAEERNRLCALNEAYENSQRGSPPCPQVGRGGSASVNVKDIEVGRGTGGIDEGRGRSGDEGIQVVIVPRDGDGSAVKAPGGARVTAVQVSPEGLKTPLSTWDVSPPYLCRNWKTGLLSSGYYVSVPWQVLPTSEKLRIVVQFQTPDGAMFEAERDIQVRLPHLHAEPAPKPLDPGIIPAPAGPVGVPTLIPAPPQFDPTAPLPPPTPWTAGPDVGSPTISQKPLATLGKPQTWQPASNNSR
jgi:hypothetical protein